MPRFLNLVIYITVAVTISKSAVNFLNSWSNKGSSIFNYLFLSILRKSVLNSPHYFYRPHPKDGEGNVFTLSTPGMGGGSGPAGGGGQVKGQSSRGGQGQRSIQPGGSGQRSIQPGGGGRVQPGASGQRSIQPGGSGPAGWGGVRSSQRGGGGGQHLAPSCGRYASCVHAGGLSCFRCVFSFWEG